MRHFTFIFFFNLMLLRCESATAVDLPERPVGYILDQGHVFPPEIAARLSDRLQACAREYDIHIYAVTLPTLNVMPSRVREKLDELGTTSAKNWLKEKLGAVIVFDDEAGWVMIALSDRVEREFSNAELNMLLKDPMIQARKPGQSPKKLESAALILVDGLSGMKARITREEERHATVRRIFIAVLLGMCGLAALITVGKQRSAAEGPARKSGIES